MSAPAGPFRVINRHVGAGWERRWACETLERAKLRASHAASPASWGEGVTASQRVVIRRSIRDLTESGGSISLPDGSEIVVARVARGDLAAEVAPESFRAYAEMPLAELCAAYNARFGTVARDAELASRGRGDRAD